MPLTVVDHPLARHYITHLRDRDTRPALFRTLTRKLTALLALEAVRDLRTQPVRVDTPMEPTDGEVISEAIVVVPVLRAGLGMLDVVADLLPDVAVGYIGLERDESTARAASYYCKLPPVDGRRVLVMDPMLATGGSAVRALEEVCRLGAASAALVCIVAAPQGVAAVEGAFPHVRIVTAALDRGLDDRKYILPGLGDFGDRLYGTAGWSP